MPRMVNYLELAKNVLEMEAQSIKVMSDRLNQVSIDSLVQQFSYLNTEGGSLVFCGVGKSGNIAQKLSSTFCSLGLSSFYLHPVDALHGDLGRVKGNDVICFISKSGNTEEILKLMPFVDIPNDHRIGLLGEVNSSIAKSCSLVLDCSVEKEACLNNQAPTTSSTCALAMGDMMGVIYESFVGLSKEGFAANHPGGALGKSLRMKVGDLLIERDLCPVVDEYAPFKDVVLKMTQHPVGGCAVVDANGELKGLITEGDIRRSLTHKKGANEVLESAVTNWMNKSPLTINVDVLAYKALTLMEGEKRQINILPVIDSEQKFVGLIRLHDLIKEGLKG